MATSFSAEHSVVFFDVNGTLLDLGALRPEYERLVPGSAISSWFTRTIQGAALESLSGQYHPFDRHAARALVVEGREAGHQISERVADEFVGLMEELPPFPEAAEALDTLGEAGFRLAALTNSPSRTLPLQMRSAGLLDRFAELISVDEVAVFKPSPAVYRHGAERMGVAVTDMVLVASHDWDVDGAIRAGARGVFVDRAGSGPSPLSERPDLIAPDLVTAAHSIVGRAIR